MSGPIARAEFVTSSISGGTVTLTLRPGTSGDPGVTITQIDISSTNPPSEFFEPNRFYLVSVQRI